MESRKISRSSSPSPAKVGQVRSQTDPNPNPTARQDPAIKPKEYPSSGETKQHHMEVEEGVREGSSGSSYHVHLGPPMTPAHQNTRHPGVPSTSTSDERNRPHSTITSDTDRSSHSSGSRIPVYSNAAPQAYTHASSSASIIQTEPPPKTPLRSPNTGLTGFKSRFFSTPTSTGTGDASPSIIKSKVEKYKGLGKEPGGTVGRKDAAGSSNLSSNAQIGSTSPRTPGQGKRVPSPPSSRFVTPEAGGSQTPSRSSLASRFLRRVVSAPNAKALFAPNFQADAPEVPPLPSNIKITSPVVKVHPSNEVDLTSSPPYDGPSNQGMTSPFGTPTPAISHPSPPASPPHRLHNGSPLNPSGSSALVTRPTRSLTVSAASKPKDPRGMLGVSAGDEPHHKQVFRRTYSSNSIKTRTVSVSSTVGS